MWRETFTKIPKGRIVVEYLSKCCYNMKGGFLAIVGLFLYTSLSTSAFKIRWVDSFFIDLKVNWGFRNQNYVEVLFSRGEETYTYLTRS